MAVVLTSLVAAFSRTPFIKIPDLQRELTSMPRSIVNFELTAATLAAKPVNDTQELNVSIVLPVEFAYRLINLSISLVQDVANDWTNRGYLEITNGVRGPQVGSTQRYQAVMDFATRIPTPSEMWIARLSNFPTDILQAIGGSAPVIVYKAHNATAAVGAAGTVNFLTTFLEYDIEQAQRFPIHWPTLTYNR